MRSNWFVGMPFALQDLAELLVDLPPSCRAFHPEDLHLTVAFLGEMDPSRVSLVTAAMDQIEMTPIEATLGRPRPLPTRWKPSALCFELDRGREQVAACMGAWREAFFDAAEAKPDIRPPLPHLTVARPLRKMGKMGRREGLGWLENLESPSQTVLLDRLALFTWAEDRHERLFKRVYEKQFDQ